MLLLVVAFTIVIPVSTTYAASPVDDVLGSLISSTVPSSSSSGGGGLLGKLFNFIFEEVLEPVLNIFNNKNIVTTAPEPTSPSASGNNESWSNGSLKGKTIVVDPGHGGSNPGAVGNNTRESDNNLAVGLKLRDKLVQAGAKVIMTRESDHTVAPEGSSLSQELQARVDIAEKNNADIFVSIHTNSNPNNSTAGAMTFYYSSESNVLAAKVQSNLIKQTGAINKGTEVATFYVLRNTSMPSVLVEMGFITNVTEAARLSSNSYRNDIAQGIYNGIVEYFKSR